MSWQIETTSRFDKEFKKLDRYTQKLIHGWITKNIDNTDDPRRHGKPLTGDLSGLWRYRIGDYRLICTLNDDRLIILALSIGHRRDIYRSAVARLRRRHRRDPGPGLGPGGGRERGARRLSGRRHFP